MTRNISIVGAFALLMLSLAACGGDEDADLGEDGVQTVEITALDELRFDPSSIEVGVGDTVRFVVTNDGAIPHDFLIGDEASQNEHEQEMQAGMGHEEEMDGEMGGEHDGPFPEAILLNPGEPKELEVTFDEAGEFLYGCHQPGHYGAGMVGTITVS